MTRLEKARLAMEEADKRAEERKREYEKMLKAEEEKIDKTILDIVHKWSKGLPEKPDWGSVPERLETILLGAEKGSETQAEEQPVERKEEVFYAENDNNQYS